MRCGLSQSIFSCAAAPAHVVRHCSSASRELLDDDTWHMRHETWHMRHVSHAPSHLLHRHMDMAHAATQAFLCLERVGGGRQTWLLDETDVAT